MNGNYQWQKQQAHDRVQARRREAEVQRMLKSESIRQEFVLIRLWRKFFGGRPTELGEQRGSRETSGRSVRAKLVDQTADSR